MGTTASCTMPLVRRRSSLVPAVLALLGLASACGGEDDDDDKITLEGSVELLDSFEYSTGQLPSTGPVQVSLTVSGSAVAKLSLPAVASDEDGDPTLYAAGQGTLEVSGGFFLDGSLKVDQPGLPKYDGDLPGLADVSLPISGSVPVSGLALEEPVTVSAAIEPGDLPPIPLPGGLPGSLQLSVADGSTIDVTVEGSCASVGESTAELRGVAVRSGTVILDIAVELDIPVVGSQTIDIGTVEVPVPESTYDAVAKASGVSLQEPPQGPKAPVCSSKTTESGEGGSGGAPGPIPSTGSSSSSSSSSGTSSTSASTSSSNSSSSSGVVYECTTDSECGADAVCRLNECKAVYDVCLNTTLHVGDLSLVEGDAEFGGHGPEVKLDIAPLVGPAGKLQLIVHLSMKETQSDWSTGTNSETFNFNYPISEVLEPGLGWTYVDTDTSDDPLAGWENYLLSAVCSGDTFGNDIGTGSSYSWCEIQVGCVTVVEE
ncbi:MAG: hypothetical protein HOV80_38650 [Polyangiaceae bacterium]|nr:hypothetical protein [Polyangiaceae bacterium]